MTEEKRVVSVTELNEYIKLVLDSDYLLQGIYIRGEISNFKLSMPAGHMYFTLKDEGGAVSAVMFRSSAARLKFVPENGMKVIVGGRISSYVKSGQYQIYAETMEPDGIGALYIAYEQLKKKLTEEGLFDRPKKPIPDYPKKIGVITSPTGAAVRDIINVTGRRSPSTEIILFPSLVQGEEAAPNLIEGMKYFNSRTDIDVIIIGRGGGSLEDLWAFNDEMLVRTVADSNIPVISAVGHETDFTLCDFAADMRAPTPSAAAEIAVPDWYEIFRNIGNLKIRMINAELSRLEKLKQKVAEYKNSRVLTNPQNVFEDRRMALGTDEQRLYDLFRTLVLMKKSRLSEDAAKLEALSPLKVIGRGYSAVFTKDKKVISSVSDVKDGDRVSFMVTDGRVDAVVTGTEKNNGK